MKCLYAIAVAGLCVAGLFVAAASHGCAPAKESDDEDDSIGGASGSTSGGAGSSADTAGNNSSSGGDGDGDSAGNGSSPSAGSGSSSNVGNGGSSNAGSGEPGGSGGDGAAGTGEEPIEIPVEALPDGVDWTALTVGAADTLGNVHPHMYTAFDGVQSFKVPARVLGATVELEGWLAVPADAVLFEPDPDTESGGVMITVLSAEPEITIAAMTSDMLLGGTALLHVFEATEQDWIDGEARYNNGVDFVLPMISFVDLLDPNYVPPETPKDLACNNCHTTGAKYFEFQHTPRQIAYISDEDLITIFTLGMKPPGVAWSIIPEQLQHLYVDFHTWEATTQEQEALIVYLRALTPIVQGDIVIPDAIFTP